MVLLVSFVAALVAASDIAAVAVVAVDVAAVAVVVVAVAVDVGVATDDWPLCHCFAG